MMYKFENGEYIPLTEEEIDALKNRKRVPLITLDDRIEALEQAISDLAIQTMVVGIDD